jgi:hypothetical protein
MNRAALFQSMEGSKEPTINSLTTSALYRNKGSSTNRDVNIYERQPDCLNIMNQTNDYSTRRCVLPCVGINTFTIRTPKESSKLTGIRPLGGQSRTQNPSVVNPRPLDLPLLIPKSSINAGMNTSIKIPGA